MIEDSLLPFSFPAVGRKKITAAFDGGRITSDLLEGDRPPGGRRSRLAAK